jgi:hypothetical protein
VRVIKSVGVGAVVVSLAFAQTVRADECGDAVRDYNSVIGRLEDAMQQFSTCVANSLGRHSCSREFIRLRSAYGEFESAVSVYTKQCI